MSRIQLSRLVMQELNRKQQGFGAKFIGNLQQLTPMNGQALQQREQKITVKNKKTGSVYNITKKFYQQHKNDYKLPVSKKLVKLKTDKEKPKQGDKFIGDASELEYQTSIQQFKKNINSTQFVEQNLHNYFKQSDRNLDIVRGMGGQHFYFVREYTKEWYLKINRELRQRDMQYIDKDLIEAIDNISEALASCQKFSGVAMRVLVQDRNSQMNLKIGDTFEFKSFTSTTANIHKSMQKYLRSVLDIEHYDKIYNIYIKSKKGVAINSISMYTSQYQVLFDKKSQFRLIGMQQGHLETILYMEEI